MTPNGQFAYPLDKAAIREPFLTDSFTREARSRRKAAVRRGVLMPHCGPPKLPFVHRAENLTWRQSLCEAAIRPLRRVRLVMVSNSKAHYHACMVGKNIFIRPPYVECPKCGKQALGLIYVGGSKLAMRCAECDFIRHEALPDLDKKVIYVDQNLFSYLFQHENGGKLPEGHEQFIHEAHAKLRRLVLLQQVVMPMSDIHFDESLVFYDEKALRHAIEFLGGDARLKDVPDLELAQTLIAAKAFLNSSEAEYPDSIDVVMDSRRNDWIPDMHITSNVDFSQFADDVRKTRDQGHEEMRKILDRWASQKVPFKDVLAEEMNSMLQSKMDALAFYVRRFQHAMQSSDPGELFDRHFPSNLVLGGD